MPVPPNQAVDSFMDFVIQGECLVTVKGASSSNIPSVAELGLAAPDGITITPRFNHKDVHVDDFGPDVPAEVMFMLADVLISMNLIFYDKAVLMACVSESMASSLNNEDFLQVNAATQPVALAGAGTLMVGYQNLYGPRNHLISVSLLCPNQENYPWRFLGCYLTGPPLVWPVGTKATIAQLNWRAIPVVAPPIAGFEIKSENALLWDHEPFDPDNPED